MNPGMGEKIKTAAESLLAQAGFSRDAARYSPLSGGRNNRVYRVDTPAGTFLLKQYYRNGDWDRLAAESRFLRFCEQAGIGQTPRLIAEDAANGVALHSWIDGGYLDSPCLSGEDIADAAMFAGALARASRRMRERRNAAISIPPARDACLCLEDFFRSPRERVADLEKALLARPERPETPMTREALEFVRETLLPEWERAEKTVAKAFARSDLIKPFPTESLMVSPSDFGFHNALRHRDGVSFIDFEYAGMDDPAKMIGDFVCQADFSPPQGTLERLAAAVRGDAGQAEALAARTRALLPLFRIKFCCIVMNEFKNTDAARRQFSLGGQLEKMLGQQLSKAAAMLKKDG